MHATSLLDHPLISQRYFFPRPEAPAQPFWIDSNGARLACSYHQCAAQAPIIVYFHGNGEVVADMIDLLPRIFAGMGCNCLLAEYRGYGGSTETPQLGRMLADVRPTLEALHCAEDRLILFGRSVGSLFAIKAAEECPRVAGLILESAIADPLERLLLRVDPAELGTTRQKLEAALQSHLDIAQVLRHFRRPVLIMHTRHDGLIDVSHAERLASWCAGPVRLQIFPRGHHNDIMAVNGREYFRLVEEFIASIG